MPFFIQLHEASFSQPPDLGHCNGRHHDLGLVRAEHTTARRATHRVYLGCGKPEAGHHVLRGVRRRRLVCLVSDVG